jgi:hypothetical protein
MYECVVVVLFLRLFLQFFSKVEDDSGPHVFYLSFSARTDPEGEHSLTAIISRRPNDWLVPLSVSVHLFSFFFSLLPLLVHVRMNGEKPPRHVARPEWSAAAWPPFFFFFFSFLF